MVVTHAEAAKLAETSESLKIRIAIFAALHYLIRDRSNREIQQKTYDSCLDFVIFELLSREGTNKDNNFEPEIFQNVNIAKRHLTKDSVTASCCQYLPFELRI